MKAAKTKLDIALDLVLMGLYKCGLNWTCVVYHADTGNFSPKNFAPQVAEILAAGIRVLIYAGMLRTHKTWLMAHPFHITDMK